MGNKEALPSAVKKVIYYTIGISMIAFILLILTIIFFNIPTKYNSIEDINNNDSNLFIYSSAKTISPIDEGITSITTTTKNQSFMTFDGVNDHLIYDGNPFNNDIVYNLTYSVWVNLKGYSGNDMGLVNVMEKNAGYNHTVILVLDEASGSYTVLLGVGNDSQRNYYGNHKITSTNKSIGQWVHYLATFEDGNISIYEDGVLNFSQSTGYDFVNLTNANLSISQFNTGTGSLLGDIDEVRVYNKSLTPTQILEINNSGRSPNSSLPSDGLVVWYAFNENSGTTVYDLSGNGYNAV